MLPGVKIDRIRQLTFYDYVGAATNGVPGDIKEFVNNTEWNGLESPSIAYDFPTMGSANCHAWGRPNCGRSLMFPLCLWAAIRCTSIYRNSRFLIE